MKPVKKHELPVHWVDKTDISIVVRRLWESHLKKVKELQQRDRNGIVYGPIQKNTFKSKRFR